MTDFQHCPRGGDGPGLPENGRTTAERAHSATEAVHSDAKNRAKNASNLHFACPENAHPPYLVTGLGFAGLVYCLADCLGECASTPGAPDEWEPLQHMAGSALRAWQALLAEHGPAITTAHQNISQARRQGLATVEVPAELLALLIGEGQP